jgi:hypothetical protein
MALTSSTVSSDRIAVRMASIRPAGSAREVSEEYGLKQVEAGLKKQERGLEAMKQAGTTFHTPSFTELQKWANMLPNIPQQEADEANAKGWPGTAVIRGYIEGLEADGFKFPRRWTVK